MAKKKPRSNGKFYNKKPLTPEKAARLACKHAFALPKVTGDELLQRLFVGDDGHLTLSGKQFERRKKTFLDLVQNLKEYHVNVWLTYNIDDSDGIFNLCMESKEYAPEKVALQQDCKSYKPGEGGLMLVNLERLLSLTESVYLMAEKVKVQEDFQNSLVLCEVLTPNFGFGQGRIIVRDSLRTNTRPEKMIFKGGKEGQKELEAFLKANTLRAELDSFILSRGYHNRVRVLYSEGTFQVEVRDHLIEAKAYSKKNIEYAMRMISVYAAKAN